MKPGMRLDVRARKMPQRARDTLSAFPWADDAAKVWSVLTIQERRRVFAAVRAEEEASRQYCLADDMIERVREVLAPEAKAAASRAKVRFTP